MGAAIKKAWIDHGLEKMMSRKLLVFVLTTLFFVLEMIDSQDWIMIAVAYVSTQGIVDVVTKFKKGVKW